MKSQLVKAFGLALATSISVSAYAQQRAVNIVFTSPEKMQTIDAVIGEGEEELTALLDQHNLSMDEIQLIDINGMTGHWMEEGGEHKIMVIDIEEEANNGDKQGKVKILTIDNGMETEMELDLDELEQKMAEMEINMQGIAEEMEFTKEFVFEKSGEGDDEEISIEVEFIDGKEVIKATRNGEPISEEEAKAIMAEHEQMRAIHMDERVLAIEKHAEAIEAHRQHTEEIRRHVEVRHQEIHSAENVKAIVIIKNLDANGADEISMEDNHLRAFPNPAGNETTITFDNIKGEYTLNVTNLAGQQVFQINEKAKGKVSHKIDLSNFASGTYIVHLNHNKGLQSTKFVKE